jgi:hypothetical protein
LAGGGFAAVKHNDAAARVGLSLGQIVPPVPGPRTMWLTPRSRCLRRSTGTITYQSAIGPTRALHRVGSNGVVVSPLVTP